MGVGHFWTPMSNFQLTAHLRIIFLTFTLIFGIILLILSEGNPQNLKFLNFKVGFQLVLRCPSRLSSH
jgi:hypothetical protein